MGLGPFSLSHGKYPLAKEKSANGAEKEGPRKGVGGRNSKRAASVFGNELPNNSSRFGGEWQVLGMWGPWLAPSRAAPTLLNLLGTSGATSWGPMSPQRAPASCF